MSPRVDAVGTDDAQRHSNLAWARSLIDELIRGGVRHVALSPGSRSTPLAWAVAERAGLLLGPATERVVAGDAEADGRRDPDADGRLSLSIHVDERSAAFFALGRSRVSGLPSACICTSGTAGVNYAPAVVEAHHSRVPLLLLTADRPPELRDSGAWQTIDQTQLYTGFTRWFCDLPPPSPGDLDGGMMTRYLRAVAARAAASAIGPPAGPVHLNLPFREPLAPPEDVDSATASTQRQRHSALAGRSGGAPWTATTRSTRLPASADLDALVSAIADEPRGLLLAGTSAAPLRHGAAWAEAMAALAEAADWPLLAEPTGGLRFGAHDRTRVLTGYAAMLRHAAWREAETNAPGMTLRFGMSFTWKHVALYLQHHKAGRHVVVDPEDAWDEPTRGATLRVVADPLPLIRALTAGLVACGERVATRAAAAADWQARWRAAEAAADSARRHAVAGAARGTAAAVVTAPYHDLLRRALPAGSLIWAANSMAVRDLDTYAAGGDERLVALASRGAAGIDGTLSTALGAAHAHGGPTCLLTGDLAFLHDLNGLGLRDGHGARPGELDLFVVVFDDGGGGIFEHLPVASRNRTAFETLFGTPPGIDLDAAARLYGHPFAQARSPDDLALQLATWRATGGVRIVRVPIDRATNTEAHRALWSAIAVGLDRQREAEEAAVRMRSST